jgi:cytochrome b pre-mRNA-processing protein 3
MLLRLHRRRQRQQTIDVLYGAVVAQARAPEFYRSLSVPDTMEARFDMILLHVHLLFRRLVQGDAESRRVGQALFDTFLADMEASLRESGTGDLAVPRKMRAIGEAFYGRARSYDAALTERTDKLLSAALARNVYGNDAGSAPRLARYVRSVIGALDAQHPREIARGEVRFPSPEE